MTFIIPRISGDYSTFNIDIKYYINNYANYSEKKLGSIFKQDVSHTHHPYQIPDLVLSLQSNQVILDLSLHKRDRTPRPL